MNHIEKQHFLEWLAYLIQQEETGNLKEFAQKCEIEERTLSNQIDILRQYTGVEGAQILYDKKRKTYYFDPKGKFTSFKFFEIY
jgi:transcriptional antiterminator